MVEDEETDRDTRLANVGEIARGRDAPAEYDRRVLQPIEIQTILCIAQLLLTGDFITVNGVGPDIRREWTIQRFYFLRKHQSTKERECENNSTHR
ncbi:hypothetical protein QCM77_22610 [Bradyrhizobium sp. SSUT18]|uniref:hypothetical protein n=1 Tax=Bradyrhizobium sp. SSUT18 TaxID=3040602 RepID=UPI00244C2199|nr:hypothetical protein [Bradyrhizobium sp. SSUT18]MDH2402735.1 hypothetical protein [Bradyrhizobium sp. SSUT18]